VIPSFFRSFLIERARQQQIAALVSIELPAGTDLCGGIDAPEPFGHDLGLGLAHRSVKDMKLPIDIGEADIIEIDGPFLPGHYCCEPQGFRAAMTSAIPPRIATAEITSRMVTTSPRKITPPAAARTGTLSCTVAALVALNPRNAVYHIA
jgi:hypothetical protein